MRVCGRFDNIIGRSIMLLSIFAFAFVLPNATAASIGGNPAILSNQIIGVNQGFNSTAVGLITSDGVRYFRTLASTQPSSIQAAKIAYLTYNDQFLMIISTWTIQPQPVMSGNVLAPGCISNCNWTLNDWKSAVQNTVSAYPFVTTWEIWNEPSYPRFQSGYQDGNYTHYAKMIEVAAPIIHQANPNAIVVCFGGAPIGAGPEVQWYLDVWKTLGANATKDCNAISIHAYQSGNNTISATTAIAWNSSLATYENTTHVPIWITETGKQATQEMNKKAAYSDQNQNVFLNGSFSLMASDKYVARVYWFDLYGLSDAPLNRDFGLYNYTTMQPRPAQKTFMEFYNKSLSRKMTPATVAYAPALSIRNLSPTYGTTISIIAKPSLLLDEVKITENGNVIASGTGTATFLGYLSAGKHQIVATDLTDGLSTPISTIQVAKATPVLSMMIPSNYTYDGTPAKIVGKISTINNQLSANMSISYGIVSTYNTSYTYEIYTAGIHTVSESTKGNENYTSYSTSPVRFNMLKATPVLTLDIPANFTYNGDPATIGASISSIYNQLTANLVLGSTLLSSFRTSNTVKYATAGTYVFRLSTLGNSNYTSANTVYIPFKISKAVPILKLNVPASFAYNGYGGKVTYSISTVGNQLTAMLKLAGNLVASTNTYGAYTINSSKRTYSFKVDVSGNANYTSANTIFMSFSIT